MMLFSSSTWLLIVVFVDVVSAASIGETEDSVKTSFISLLKNIVNINKKRIDAMKHIDEEKDFRFGSYLSKIHKVNDVLQEDEMDQKAYLSFIDMRRNFNLAFRESYTQPRLVIDDDAKMFFKPLNIINKKKVLRSYDKIIDLPSGYQSEPSSLDMINQRLKDSGKKMNNRIFRKDNDIIELPKTYLGKSNIDNIIAKLFSPDDNSEKKKKTIFQKDNTININLPKKYLRIPSIQDYILKKLKLNNIYQKKKNKSREKEDIIRTPQDIINILNHVIKDQNENILRKIVNFNCDDETAEDTKCEDDVKSEEDDIIKKRPDNVDLVFTFDDGKEVEGGQWADWSYEFADGEAFSSWENKGDRQYTRKTWSGCGKSAAKSCTSACSLAYRNFCTRYKCTRKNKKDFKKECEKTCTNEFVPSRYSEERL